MGVVVSTPLSGVISEHLDLVDEHLTEYFTPQAPNQDLPSAQKIKNKITAIGLLVDGDGDGEPDPFPVPSFSLSSQSGGTAELYASVDEVQGQVIKEVVQVHADATGVGLGEVLAEMILPVPWCGSVGRGGAQAKATQAWATVPAQEGEPPF